MSAGYQGQPDRWLDLIKRFSARGARVSVGNMREDMITHLLDAVEAIETKLKDGEV